MWLIGMRYKVLDAVTTKQVATGYAEQKMEVGSKLTSVMGFSQGAQGGLTLDGMVQRLVQQLVFEIDAKHKGAGSPPPAARYLPATVSPGAESTRATPESMMEESRRRWLPPRDQLAGVPATAATTTRGPAPAEPVQPVGWPSRHPRPPFRAGSRHPMRHPHHRPLRSN